MYELLESGSEAARVQVCQNLVSAVQSDGVWPVAVLQCNIHLSLLSLLQGGTPEEQSAAAGVISALADSSDAVAIVLRTANAHRILAKLMHLQGPRMADVRYEAAGALMKLIESTTEQGEVSSVCLTRVCTIIAESDLEAEVTCMLGLASLLCLGSSRNQIHCAVMGILPRVQQLMQHPHPRVAEKATRLMGVLAVAEENRHRFDRLHLLPHILARHMADGANVTGRCSHASQELAAQAAICALHIMRVDDSDLYLPENVRPLCEAGVMVHAVQLVQTGSVTAKAAALECLQAGLLCESKEIHLHILGLGVVPLLWDLSKGVNSKDETTEMIAKSAKQILESVDGDFDAMSHVAAAGIVPLRLHLLADNTDTVFASEGFDGDDGSGGSRRLPRLDDDDGDGNPARL